MTGQVTSPFSYIATQFSVDVKEEVNERAGDLGVFQFRQGLHTLIVSRESTLFQRGRGKR